MYSGLMKRDRSAFCPTRGAFLLQTFVVIDSSLTGLRDPAQARQSVAVPGSRLHSYERMVTLAALVCFAANSLLCRYALGEGLMDAATFITIRLAVASLVVLTGIALTLPMPESWRVQWRSVVARLPSFRAAS